MSHPDSLPPSSTAPAVAPETEIIHLAADETQVAPPEVRTPWYLELRSSYRIITVYVGPHEVPFFYEAPTLTLVSTYFRRLLFSDEAAYSKIIRLPDVPLLTFDHVDAWIRWRRVPSIRRLDTSVYIWIIANELQIQVLTNLMMDNIHQHVALYGHGDIHKYLYLHLEIYVSPSTVGTPLRRFWVDKFSRWCQTDFSNRGFSNKFDVVLDIELVIDMTRYLKAKCEEKVPGSTPDSWDLDLENITGRDLKGILLSALSRRDILGVDPPELPAHHFYVEPYDSS